MEPTGARESTPAIHKPQPETRATSSESIEFPNPMPNRKGESTEGPVDGALRRSMRKARARSAPSKNAPSAWGNAGSGGALHPPGVRAFWDAVSIDTPVNESGPRFPPAEAPRAYFVISTR